MIKNKAKKTYLHVYENYESGSRIFFAHSCCSAKECSRSGLWHILHSGSCGLPDFGGVFINFAIRCVTLYEINIDIQLFSTDRNGKGGMQ